MGKITRNLAIATFCAATGVLLGCAGSDERRAGSGASTLDGSSAAAGGAASASPPIPSGRGGAKAMPGPSATASGGTGATRDGGAAGLDASHQGSRGEAGASRDAASSRDATVPGDTGPPTDAKPSTDARPYTDAKPSTDARPSADADIPIDGHSSGDAAMPVEAGDLDDASLVDADGGGCAQACSIANAVSICTNGTCELVSCQPGFGNCDLDVTNGCEATLSVDVAHCGVCDQVCGPGEPCLGGRCLPAHCVDGVLDYDETDIDCGGPACLRCAQGALCLASKDCAALPGTPVACCQTCQLDCEPNLADCDGKPETGCEADRRTDAENCGACGHACLPSEICRLGECRSTVCTPPFASCGGKLGCDTNTDTDPSNCGGCGNVCSFPGGIAKCEGGSCVLSGCTGGADCNGLESDGCEAAWYACPLACPPGRHDCDGLFSNGCETDLDTDESNCGSCGNTCFDVGCATDRPMCVGGSCGIRSCILGAGDCDGDWGNGCETYLLADPNNCGSCGVVCKAPPGAANVEPRCAGCECTFACQKNWGDCDGTAANGCETKLCGRSCPR